MLKRLVPSSIKGKVILGVVGVLALVVAWQFLRAWWNHGVTVGYRSGIVRKIAKKGSPLCRYWMGEMVITNQAVFGALPEVWDFNVDSKNDADALIGGLQKAEAGGQRVTLQFRQDKGKWWACSNNEFYVTGITK